MGLTVADPDTAAVPVNAGVENIAVLAVNDLTDTVEVGLLMVTLETDTDFQTFGVRHFGSFDQHIETGSVDAARFFHEDVLAGFDGSLEVDRAESRRGGDDHVLRFGDGQNFAIRIESPEYFIFGNFELISGTSRVVLKRVRDSDNFRIFILKEVVPGTFTASAASDQDGFDLVAAFSVGTAGNKSAHCGRTGDDTGSLQKITTVGLSHSCSP